MVEDKEAFDGLFRRLLTVGDGSVQIRIGAARQPMCGVEIAFGNGEPTLYDFGVRFTHRGFSRAQVSGSQGKHGHGDTAQSRRVF